MQIQELHHVALHVADLTRSINFYKNVLCLEQMERPGFDFPGAWFRVGQGQELHLIDRPPKEGPYTPPRERHFALKVSDIKAAQAHLESTETEFQPPKVRPGGATQIFLRDPDQHMIELTD